MMKLFLWLIIIAFPGLAFSQIDNSLLLNLELDSGHNVRPVFFAGSSYALGSNAISNRFFNTYLFGSFISDEVKSASLSSLKSLNSFGGYGESSVSYLWGKKVSGSKSHGFFVGLKSRLQYSGKFTPDLYKIVLFGNGNYGGKTAVFDGAAYNSLGYQTFQFGYYKSTQTDRSKSLLFGFVPGIVKGSAYSHVEIEKGRFFTSPDCDSLNLDVNARYRTANPNGRFYQYAGIGLSFSSFLSCQLTEQSSIHFAISDIGFISWSHGESIDLINDFPFTGSRIDVVNGQFVVNNLKTFPDSISEFADSRKSAKNFSSALPAQFQVSYRGMLKNNWLLEASAEYILLAGYKPFVRASLGKNVTKSFTVKPGINAGGYGSAGVSLSLCYSLIRSWELMIGTDHLEAYIIRNTRSQSGFISLRDNLSF